MTDSARGIWAMVLACLIWGLSPLYYKLLSHIAPIEVLAHRTLWSFGFFALLLLGQNRLSQLWGAMASPRALLVLLFAALMISTNWFVFILSIQIGHATEASLGYYLFPLVAVALGRMVFKERLDRGQKTAVALAMAAVVVLSLGLGVAPWVALILSSSFGLYGLIKKRLTTGPVVSVTAEVLLLCPIALAVLYWRHSSGTGVFGAHFFDSALLAFSGILTASPLILFSYATKRVRLGTIGLVQYLNPSLQFFCAVVVFGEPFGPWHATAFALIWAALLIYTLAALRQESAARRAAPKAGTSPTTCT